MTSGTRWRFRSFLVLASLAFIGASTHAQKSQKPTTPKGTTATVPAAMNAHMVVTALGNGEHLDDWSGPVRWAGTIPARFIGQVKGREITWIGKAPKKGSIRVRTSSQGAGGKSLQQWMPRGTTDIQVIVTTHAAAHGSAKLPGIAPPGTTPKKKSKQPKRYTVTHRRPSTPSTEPGRQTTTTASAGSNTGTSTAKSGSTSRQGDETTTATTKQTDGTGDGKGRPDGSAQGKSGARKTAEQGALVSENATAFGKGRLAHGMKGGSGPDSAAGVASGGGLIPLINVPASLRTLTETLLIMQDANPGQLASNWMSKIGSKAGVYRVRKKLARSASQYANTHLTKHTKQIEAATRGMSDLQRSQTINRWKWEIQRQYFARVEKGASDKLLDTSLNAAERHQAQTLLEAARVKPVAGQLPRNHRYAGTNVPSERLPAAYKAKGLRFTEGGFPDFSPYAQTLPNGQKSVRIQLTGNYHRDVRLANQAAKFDPPTTPKDMVWHHREDGVTMELVPEDLHDKVRHTGGRGIYKHQTGDPGAYL